MVIFACFFSLFWVEDFPETSLIFKSPGSTLLIFDVTSHRGWFYCQYAELELEWERCPHWSYLGADRGQLVEHDNDRVQERHDLKMAALTNLE